MTQIARVAGATGRTHARGERALALARDCIALTRPRVLTLVLLTAPAGLALGHDAWPTFMTLLCVLVGTALVGGGSGALNAWYERDRDALMLRTLDRPLPAGRLTPAQALGFGLSTSTLGLLVLFAVGGWLPVAIGALTLAHYIFVYTMWLKPRTPQAIVVGGVAGAIAPVIADAALNGAIGIWSLVLFAIVFIWQPPHFLAIALYRRHEYALAGFPILPNVVGEHTTRRHMLAYALLLIPVTLLPWFAGLLGSAYALTALLGGALFVSHIVRAIRLQSSAADRRVFATSIIYLTALFAILLTDLALR